MRNFNIRSHPRANFINFWTWAVARRCGRTARLHAVMADYERPTGMVISLMFLCVVGAASCTLFAMFVRYHRQRRRLNQIMPSWPQRAAGLRTASPEEGDGSEAQQAGAPASDEEEGRAVVERLRADFLAQQARIHAMQLADEERALAHAVEDSIRSSNGFEAAAQQGCNLEEQIIQQQIEVREDTARKRQRTRMHPFSHARVCARRPRSSRACWLCRYKRGQRCARPTIKRRATMLRSARYAWSPINRTTR